MKDLIFILLFILVLTSCSDNTDPPELDYREEMRAFVIGISEYAKSVDSAFVVIPQNGIELVTTDGEENGPIHTLYVNAIDGNGQEDLFYGYQSEDKASPSNENTYLRAFLDRSRDSGKRILVTDYCSTPAKVDDSYIENFSAGYVSFAANERELNAIPGYPVPIHQESASRVAALTEVRNFLYLINPEQYASKQIFIDTIASTNYDLLIMDYFFHEGSAFTTSEIDQLRDKANGGKRMLIAYMSIGEAEDYRYYWQAGWNSQKPDWLEKENPDWAGNFKVKYWDPDWQNIIYGNDGSYLKKILDAGFDGVYLDIIDGFEYFE